jgi:putative N-acetylmannosamine-6-phosphate epimerase
VITLSQVRDAANALVTTLPFDAEHRARHLQRISDILDRTQHRNQQARRSHSKTRRRTLHALGLFTSSMRSCIPP